MCFREFVDLVETDPSTAHFFIQSPGSIDKTFLYNGISAYFRAQGKIVFYMASSGIATLLLSGGYTVYSRFKIPIPADDTFFYKVCKGSKLAVLLKQMSVII